MDTKLFDTVLRCEIVSGVHDLTNAVELQDDNPYFHPVPDGKIIEYSEEGVPIGLIDEPPLSEEVIYEALVRQEQSWAVLELEHADININLHDDSDARATATKTEWQAYRCQLRDYVKGGVVVGDRPQMPV